MGNSMVVAAAGVVVHLEGIAIEDVDRMMAAGQRVVAAACVAIHDASVTDERVHERTIAPGQMVVAALGMVVVAGPRIDPQSLPTHDGLDVRAYVPELYLHLTACDLAVFKGGRTTTMDLTARRVMGTTHA